MKAVCVCVSERVGAYVEGDSQMASPLERQLAARACKSVCLCLVGLGTGYHGAEGKRSAETLRGGEVEGSFP